MVMKLPLKKRKGDDILAEEQKWEHAQRSEGALLAPSTAWQHLSVDPAALLAMLLQHIWTGLLNLSSIMSA
jgi:hypothetical protein